MVTLRKLVSDAQADGTSGEALADAVMPRLSDRYSRWNGFKYGARPNILETDASCAAQRGPGDPPGDAMLTSRTG